MLILWLTSMLQSLYFSTTSRNNFSKFTQPFFCQINAKSYYNIHVCLHRTLKHFCIIWWKKQDLLRHWPLRMHCCIKSGSFFLIKAMPRSTPWKIPLSLEIKTLRLILISQQLAIDLMNLIAAADGAREKNGMDHNIYFPNDPYRASLSQWHPQNTFQLMAVRDSAKFKWVGGKNWGKILYFP